MQLHEYSYLCNPSPLTPHPRSREKEKGAVHGSCIEEVLLCESVGYENTGFPLIRGWGDSKNLFTKEYKKAWREEVMATHRKRVNPL